MFFPGEDGKLWPFTLLFADTLSIHPSNSQDFETCREEAKVRVRRNQLWPPRHPASHEKEEGHAELKEHYLGVSSTARSEPPFSFHLFTLSIVSTFFWRRSYRISLPAGILGYLGARNEGGAALITVKGGVLCIHQILHGPE